MGASVRRMAADLDDPTMRLDDATDVPAKPRRRWWRALVGVAAVFDDERAPGIALEIRQRLDEDFGFGEADGGLRWIERVLHA